MSNLVNTAPLLPNPTLQFDTDLVRALTNILAEDARRINGSLQKDGSEPMTGDLDFGNFTPVNAGQKYGVRSGNYTVLKTDNGVVHRYTAVATASLTAATLGVNWHYTIVANGGAVTIDPNGTETINGLLTMIIPDGSTAEIICDGTSFFTIIKPNGWLTIEKRIFSAASAVDFINLGAFASLRATGRVIMSANNTLGWRSSTDNGVSFAAGASDYSFQGNAFNDVTVSTSRVTSSFGVMSSGLQFTINTLFSDFNFAGNGCFSNSLTVVSLAAGVTTRFDGSIRGDTTARNALRILPIAGTATGYITLEGML